MLPVQTKHTRNRAVSMKLCSKLTRLLLRSSSHPHEPILHNRHRLPSCLPCKVALLHAVASTTSHRTTHRKRAQLNYSTNLATGSAPDPQIVQQVLADLENQARELTHLLWRLERARHVLVPATARSWRGLMKLAFDSALGGLAVTMDDGIATIRSAIQSTRNAIAGMGSDG